MQPVCSLASVNGAAGTASRTPRRVLVCRRSASWLPWVSTAPKKTEQRETLKRELLAAIEPLDRGAKASPDDKAEVEELASALERLNPNPKTLASPLVNGGWELLYTTSASILGLSRPPLFRPSRPIVQIIDAPNLKARNVEPGPFFNQVSASLTPMSDTKVAVKFEEFRILNLIPVKAPPSAVGELDITYLDKDLRISRGDKGNLFILTMLDRDRKP